MKLLLTLSLIVFSVAALAQENQIFISGGYVFGNIEDIDQNSTGWRINGSYEFNPWSDNWSQGIVVGYVRTTATRQGVTGEEEFKGGHLPIYFTPKYTFRADKALQLFLKGALGMHFSDYDIPLALGGTLQTGDSGFYGGLGAGININLGETLYVTAEYEWAYLGNSWYVDGFLNSATGGLGFKF